MGDTFTNHSERPRPLSTKSATTRCTLLSKPASMTLSSTMLVGKSDVDGVLSGSLLHQ